MRVVLIAHTAAHTNGALIDAWKRLGIDALTLAPAAAVAELRRDDVALFRLDVLPSLSGFEPGLGSVPALRLAGVRILNMPCALIGTHDKLETARRLKEAGLPHPRTIHVLSPDDPIDILPPVVVKPRFGSWGTDVSLCSTESDLRRCLSRLESREWFRTGGALVQELVPLQHHDLRILVAGGQVVGGIQRTAAPGEWRTNVALGGTRQRVDPAGDARALAIAAAKAVGTDLAGVDLLQTSEGDLSVLELNGAVDFDATYSLPNEDVYTRIAAALDLIHPANPAVPGNMRPPIARVGQ
jgi:RimK family alpha-L-glutamate ligase